MASNNPTARVALVTGGTGGIGTAICKRLADMGHKVATNYRNEEKAKAWQAQLKAQGYDIALAKGDVTSAEEAAAMVREVERQLGPIDILVNNAGITGDNLLARMSLEQWRGVIDTNLTGAFAVTREVVRGMMRRRWGRIVTVSSVIGLMGNAGQANYAAAKAGLIGFSKSLARELASRNITANVVAPGFIETAMTEAMPEAARAEMFDRIPVGRLGRSEDIATAVVFLASEAASYVTGQVQNLFGGLYI